MLVVIATDGSEISIGAARRAHRLVPADADIVMVTAIPPIIDPNEDATGFAGPTVSPEEADATYRSDRIAADGALAATASAWGPSPVEQVVLEGEPGPAISEFAEQRAADLIVVGSHGRGRIASTILGSVSTYLVGHAPCPVTVVRAGLVGALP